MRLAAGGYAMLVLVTIFACTRVSLAVRVTQTSGRKNGESFSCSSSFSSSSSFSTSLSSSLTPRLLLDLFPLYRYLYLLLPSSSSFSSSLRYSFTFPCSAGRTGIFVLLGFTVFDLPSCLPSLRFASSPILSANILQFPLRSSSCFFSLLPLRARIVFLRAFPRSFHSIESRQYVDFRAPIWQQAVASEVYLLELCATKRTRENQWRILWCVTG